MPTVAAAIAWASSRQPFWALSGVPAVPFLLSMSRLKGTKNRVSPELQS